MDHLIDNAILFAVEKHSGQVRKISGIPYIIHPMEVFSIIGTMTGDREVMAAGILHDVVEDSGVSPEEIRERFGERVAALVASETENKRPDMPKDQSWRIRKEESVRDLQNATDPGVRILWLADKLSNVRSFCQEYRSVGDRLWERLNQKDPAEHEWFYRTIAEATAELKDTEAYREYVERLNMLFGGQAT